MASTPQTTNGISLLGLPIFSETHENVGRVADVLITSDGRSMTGVIVARGESRWFVRKDDILEMRMAGITIRDGSGMQALPPSDGQTMTAADEYDSGEVETLPDGAISIPLLEERAVVTKRMFVRERIVIRKDVETRTETISDEVRRERAEVERE